VASPIIQTAFVTGEVAPALFGHVDLVRMHSAAATMRNMWPSYRGGAYSRAGTEYVGFSKQTGRAYPPRMIPFQFSINQGLALEFGNYYMRVIFDGAYVTEAPYVVTAATQATPCVLTLSTVSTLASATPNNGAVAASYAPGDTISLAGGAFTTRAVVSVNQTLLSSVAINGRGAGAYAPGNQLTLAGGTAITRPVVQVVTTRVNGATLLQAGAGGTPGPANLIGDFGTGTKWQVDVVIGGGGTVISFGPITVRGSYTVNPSTGTYGPDTDQMSGGGFAVGPHFAISMQVDTIAIVNPGLFLANAPGGTFTQYSSTGAGVGATFQTGLFAPASLSVSVAGAYTALPANPVAQFATSGAGAGVTITAVWSSPGALATGDWVFVDDIAGMTQLNGRTFVATVVGATISLADVYGNAINSTAYGAYVSGGTVSRIFTLTTQYSEVDLKWIKLTESADVMSLCCVNQDTGTEYPPVDLARLSDTSWVFTNAVPAPSVSPPPRAGGRHKRGWIGRLSVCGDGDQPGGRLGKHRIADRQGECCGQSGGYARHHHADMDRRRRRERIQHL
jgi:hypothetical protein